ncbi:hypothetical protein OSTOST_22445 [Ostertagia ostertagi]
MVLVACWPPTDPYLNMFTTILFCLFVSVISQQKKIVTVGIAAVEKCATIIHGFLTKAVAPIGLALDRMRSEGITYGFDFKFVVNYTECSSETAVGVALEQMVKQNVDVVIGPPCPTC